MYLFNKTIQLIHIAYEFPDLKCLTHIINNCNIIVCIEQYFFLFLQKLLAQHINTVAILIRVFMNISI